MALEQRDASAQPIAQVVAQVVERQGEIIIHALVFRALIHAPANAADRPTWRQTLTTKSYM